MGGEELLGRFSWLEESAGSEDGGDGKLGVHSLVIGGLSFTD